MMNFVNVLNCDVVVSVTVVVVVVVVVVAVVVVVVVVGNKDFNQDNEDEKIWLDFLQLHVFVQLDLRVAGARTFEPTARRQHPERHSVLGQVPEQASRTCRGRCGRNFRVKILLSEFPTPIIFKLNIILLCSCLGGWSTGLQHWLQPWAR